MQDTGQIPLDPASATGEMPFDNSQAASPQPAAGAMEKAKADIMIAMKMMEQALPVLGSTTEYGKAVMESLAKLGKVYGNTGKEGDLTNTQMLQMLSTLPGDMQSQLPPQQSGQPTSSQLSPAFFQGGGA